MIADEVYGHLCFGDDPFVPMGIFGSVVPVITLGSISKRWAVPGWRLGWIAINDPLKMLQESAVLTSLFLSFSYKLLATWHKLLLFCRLRLWSALRSVLIVPLNPLPSFRFVIVWIC